MLCCYKNVFVFVYTNECIDVNTALKNSFKSMSCLGRIHQFLRNYLCWQAPVCIKFYSFKSMAWIVSRNLSALCMYQCTDWQVQFNSCILAQYYKKFTNICNKLECLMLASLYGLIWSFAVKAEAYLSEAPLCCSTLGYAPGLTLKHWIRLERLARNKHSRSVQTFINYGRKSFITLTHCSTMVEHPI